MRLYASPALGLLLLLAPALARADDAARIEALEREVSDLKMLVQDLQAQPRDASPSAASDPSLASEVPATGAWTPSLELRGFGHLQYDFESHPVEGTSGNTNHFTEGGMDLFITSELAPKLHFLSETLFEFEEDGETVIDVERLLLKYDYADALSAAIGRGHTALGYWNQHYHHGTWLQTTTDRPLLYRFEDDGGILPEHFVGFELSGDLETAPGLLSYVINVANGRGEITDEIQLIEDKNDAKMFAGMLRFAPEAIPGLAFGVNALVDKIPSQPENPDRSGSIREIIAGFHVVYTESPWEILLESQYIHHVDQVTDQAHESWGGYFQAGYRIGKFTPYYRFDLLGIDERDPFYADLPLVQDSTQYTVGVRYDWQTFAAMKLEYRRLIARSTHSNAVTAQVSFAF